MELISPPKSAPRTRKVHGTYQLSATLESERVPDVDQRFNKARVTALRWMNRRLKTELGFSLPQVAWEGENFEIDKHGQLYAAVALPDLELWTCRIEHHDQRVAARTWTVDLALRRTGASVILLQRTLCTSPSNCDHFAPLTVPRVIRDFAAELGLRDVLPITPNPWFLQSGGDLDLLQLALADPHRLLPVVMLTETEDNPRYSYKVDRFVLDPSKIADDLLGLAHVVVMPRMLGFEWTNRVGKPWTAFNGAIRTFRPTLDFANDDPYRHPLAKLDDIVMWEYDGVLSNGNVLRSEAGFQAFLKEKMFQTVASRPLRQEDTLFYRYAKMRALSERNAAKSGANTAEAELRLEIDELKKQVEEEQGEKNYVWEELAKQEEAVQALERERHNLRAQLEILRNALGQAARAEIPIPESLQDLEDWQKHVAGQLVLAPKAIRAAAKSDFRQPSLVYESLLLLANEYRQMRLYGGDCRAAYEDGLRSLKLTEARSISDSRVGEQGDEYYVNHPLQPTRRLFLEDHLRRGNDRDQRNTMRIYFAWDKDEHVVVVGWLPSHLDTRNT